VPKQTITYEPQVLDLVLYAGDGANFRLVVTDPAGVPMNLTGSMKAQIREGRDTSDQMKASFTVDLTGAATGIAILSLTGAQTQALAPSDKFVGVWDLEWTATGKQPLTLCQGKVECLQDVSR
jgi:hypothetical protein